MRCWRSPRASAGSTVASRSTSAAIVGEQRCGPTSPRRRRRGLGLQSLAGARRPVRRPASDRGDSRRTWCENAIRHNIPAGRVRVWVQDDRGEATLAVANTGSPISADEIDRLLQPFQRLMGERTGQGDGFGLGLSIVAAIVDAHDAMAARASARARPGRSAGRGPLPRGGRTASPTCLRSSRTGRRSSGPPAGRPELLPAGTAEVARR